MSQTTVIGVRVPPEAAERLREIADDNASTISRTAGRLIVRALRAEQSIVRRALADASEAR